MIPGESGRLKILTIGPETLIAVLTLKARLQLDGVPDGAQVVDCGYDIYRRSFYLTLEHETFEPVPQGEYIPPLIAGITAEFNYSKEVGHDYSGQRINV
jgi:hypothetical protein